MRAVAMFEPGDLGGVKVADLEPPTLGPNDVLVEMRAAALNHLDLWTVQGLPGIEPALPHILGADGAGEVTEVGSEVTGIRPGARVMIDPALTCRSCERCNAGEQAECVDFKMMGEHEPGTLAELVRVPATNVYPFPQHLSFEEAAALGTTAITAYRMLFTKGRLRPGEWVLVTGIGGGLALSLFQLARPVAGRVFVTSSSAAKLERALELGADHGINYREEDVGKAVRKLTAKRGVDIVVDSAGGPSLDGSLRSLRKGGRVVIAGATAGGTAEVNLRRVFWNQLQIVGSTMGSVSDVSEMLRLVAGTEMRPIIDRTFTLEEATDALAYLNEQEQFGKVVVSFA